MRFKAAAVQFTPVKANLAANLDRIAEILRQCSEEEVELAVFSETATTAYFLEGGVYECSQTADELLGDLVARTSGLKKQIDALIGFYERFEGHLFNSAAYVELGPNPRLVHTYRKFFLPTYGVFDEERFVSRGHELGLFTSRLGRVGVLICEDAWHSVLATLLAVGGAQVVMVPSASPARGFEGESVGNLERYSRMIGAICDEHGVYCVNSQLCGFEGGKGFVGGSSIVDPFGKVLTQAAVGEEALVTATIDLDMVEVARTQLPLLSDLGSAWGDITKIMQSLDTSG